MLCNVDETSHGASFMAKKNGKKGAIGILTGGGDVPGPEPGDSRGDYSSVARRVPGHWTAARMGSLVDVIREEDYDNSDNFQLLTEEIVNRAGRTGGTFLHSSRTNPSKMSKANVPAHLKDIYHRRKKRPDARGPEEPGVAGHRLPDSHRRRRHAQLWRAAVQGGS